MKKRKSSAQLRQIKRGNGGSERERGCDHVPAGSVFTGKRDLLCLCRDSELVRLKEPACSVGKAFMHRMAQL